ncbi:MAG: FkbM family methyltransferase, partial [Kutzneria sp.]|nr:FkbM family methyltransferase [Kutzneria sp.]
LDQLALEHGIVLVPHVLEPMPRDGLRPSEGDIMASGVFNLGYVTVSRKALPFLDFWAERLRHDAISSVSEQLFTDQRWVDNVPAMFEHTVVRDPGFDVAYWNVYQRELAVAEDGSLHADGVPLRFFHFSGYRPEKPWLLSTHYADKPRVLLSENPLLARLCDGYREKLAAAGYAESLESVPYRWNVMADGTPLSTSLRRAYRYAWVEAERKGRRPPPTPFDTADPQGFLSWACSPADSAQAAVGMSRWAMSVWQARADLHLAFPDPLGEDAEEFRHWCATSGVAEGELHHDAVPTGPRPGAAVAVVDELGVNVLGYLTAELGVGEMGRLALDAVLASGLPVATVVEEQTVRNRTGHVLPDGVHTEPPRFPVSLVCVNADMTSATLRMHPGLAAGRHVIGLWSWELEEFPEWMHGAFGLVDEVWTISEYCRRAIAAHSPVPVHTFPVPVRDPLEGGPPQARPSGGPVRFLFAFDYNSVFDRKNPLGLVHAFRLAFPDRTDVELVIKSINGDQHLAQRERLRVAVGDDVRIRLLEDYLTGSEVRQLFASADCYVSLHRSEGFGLTVAEAMAHGLPVIATDYSGTAEFLVEGTGWLVPCRRVPVGENQHPYPPAAQWAEPDVSSAVEALRAVAADPAQARRRGLAARRHVLSTRTFQRASAWTAERVASAGERWRDRRRGTPVASRPVRDALTPVRESREALRWRADPQSSSRLPIAPLMRRAVLRMIDHYDVHQRRILDHLMDGVEGGLSRVADTERRAEERITVRQERLEGRVAELERLGKQVAADAEERARQNADLTARLAAAERRCRQLDEKLVGMMENRDARLDETALAAMDLSRRVRALDLGVRSHHDLLDPVTDLPPSEAVPTDVGILRLPVGDTVVLPWLRTYSTWEERESRLIDDLLRPGDTFVDIGAHVGYYTIRALRRIGAEGAVFAVEPWQTLRDLLVHNVRVNLPEPVAQRLTLLPVAAWDQDQPLRLALAADGNSGDNRISGNGHIAVPGVALAGVEALRTRRLSVVKVDAQGRDHRALSGLAPLLIRDRPHVVCEFWPEGIGELGDSPAETLDRYRSW